MKNKREISVVFVSTIAFTFLFYKNNIGLNLLIYEALLIGWLLYSKQLPLKNINQVSIFIGILITAISIVIVNSLMVIFINILLMFLFVGVLIYPNIRSYISAFGLAICNIFFSFVIFFQKLFSANIKGKNLGNYFKRLVIFLIPLSIIAVFILIYQNSNPVFKNLLTNFGDLIQRYVFFIFERFDPTVIATLIIGLILSIFIIARYLTKEIAVCDEQANDDLVRIRKGKLQNRYIAFKNEWRVSIFLFVILNLVIALQNSLDIYWVWFHFDWNTVLLKQFVHEGTYLLILSILFSIALVLYFFRSNINFFSKNKVLKYLCYVWIIQNAILVISVAIRNFWYIYYFSLAYKRIGVIIFLLMTLYGLYSIYIKVKKRKTGFYLLKVNTYAVLLILVFFSIFNWDTFIARYNFSHSYSSFLHLSFLASLSDKTLPYLDIPLTELKAIDNFQKTKFAYSKNYMTAEQFHKIIWYRKIKFIERYENQSFLSWNLSEYMAYRKLKTNKGIE